MRLLIVEGNQKSRVTTAAKKGICSASKVYENAIRCFFPEVEIDTVFGADGERLPEGMSYWDYDGLVMGGSGMHAYDNTPEVTNQIQLILEFSETGRPILGSCWGLQIAAIAGGGEVKLNVVGQELGIARKILLNEAGRQHPFYQGKRPVFDSPCIHYDEVTKLPEGSTLLCGNSHSQVQGAIIPLGKSEVWAVQYHPEFDLAQLRMLFELYGSDMLEQGFVCDEENYREFLDKYQTLECQPDNEALAWQLGIDEDVLDNRFRSLEIINWVNHAKNFNADLK